MTQRGTTPSRVRPARAARHTSARVAVAVVIMAATVIAVAPAPAAAAEACPRECSGHGTCGTSHQCTCNSRWTGADCSRRACASGVSWVDKVIADDDAHNTRECSNAGICNYDTGVCACMDGFTGDACDRTTCPNDCNDRGTCISIADMSADHGVDTTPGVAGDGEGPTYANWDASVTHGCACDYGNTGGDCSLRMCPVGQDARIDNNDYRVIKITTTNSIATALIGTFRFEFAGNYADLVDANGDNSNAATVKAAFESMEAVEEATVFQGSVEATEKGTTYIVALKFDAAGQNNLHTFDGNPSINLFTCDASRITSGGTPTCAITDVDMSMSVAGNSDGVATYKVRIEDGSTDPNTFSWSRDNGAWSAPANIVEGTNQGLDASVTVNFVSELGHAYRAQWEIAATGASATLSSSPDTLEAVQCGGRGLCNETTGTCHCAMGYDGLACERNSWRNTTDEASHPWAFKHLNTSKSDYAGSVLRIEGGPFASMYYSDLVESDTFSVIRGIANGATNFRVSGLGDVSVDTGTITNLLAAGQIKPQSGFTMTSGGVNVDAGGVTVEGGELLIPAEGASITATAPTAVAHTVASTSGTFSDSVLEVKAADTAGPGDFRLLDLLSSTTTRVFDVQDNGLLTIAGGIHVSGSGATVASNGLSLDTGHMTVTAGGLYVTHAADDQVLEFTNTNGGYTTTSLLKGSTTRAADSGFNLVHFRTGGASDLVTIRGDGLYRAYSGGLEVTDGATIEAGGLRVSANSATVIAGGLQVDSGGLTVTAAGLAVDANGVEVVSSSSGVQTVSAVASNSGLTGGMNIVNVDATTVGPGVYHLGYFQEGANERFSVNGNGLTTFTGDVIVGDTSADVLTVNAVLANQDPLIFEGANTADGYQATLRVATLTADRTLTLSDRSMDPVVWAGAVTNNRLLRTQSSVVSSAFVDLTYSPTTANLDGPNALTLQSSAGTVAINSETTSIYTATNGDLTMASTTQEVKVLATDATNGNMVATAGNTAAVTSGAALTFASADAVNPSGAVSVFTGDGSAGAVGALTISSSTATGGAAGAITGKVGETNTLGGGAVAITAGKQTTDSNTGGAVTITGGEADGGLTFPPHKVVTGGSVLLVGGAGNAGGTSTGGSIVLRAGAGTTDGVVRVNDASGTARITVAADGGVVMTSPTTTITSVGAMTLDAGTVSAAALSATAQTSMTITSTTSTLAATSKTAMSLSTVDVAGGEAGAITVAVGETDSAADGKALTVSAGDTTGDTSYTGGAVVVTGGAATGTTATGGSVRVSGGTGNGNDGGSVQLTPGDGVNDGEFIVALAGGAEAIKSDLLGAITATTALSTATVQAGTGALLLASSANQATLESNGAVAVTSTAADVTFEGATSVNIVTAGPLATAGAIQILSGGSTFETNNGADVAIIGGKSTDNPGTGGDVSLVAGDDTAGGGTQQGGDVVITAGVAPDSNGALYLKSAVDAAGASSTVASTAEGYFLIDALSTLDIATRDIAGGSAAMLLGSGDASAGATGSMQLSVGTAVGGASGTVSVTAGETDAANGAAVTVTAGKTTAASSTGGTVVIKGGQASSLTTTTGGSVVVYAGNGGAGGTTTGGSVTLIPGDGTGGGGVDGSVRFLDPDGSTDRIVVDKDGAISFAGSTAATSSYTAGTAMTVAATATTVAITANGAMTASTTGAGSDIDVTAETALTLQTSDEWTGTGVVAITVGSSDLDGGAVTVQGGKCITAASKTAGAVTITGGEGSRLEVEDVGSTGGSVVVVGGAAPDATLTGSTAGDVIARAGDGGTTDGRVIMQEGAGPTPRLTVSATGALVLDAIADGGFSTTAGSVAMSSTTTLALTGNAAVAITSTTDEVTITAETTLTVKTDDITGSGAGTVAFVAGSTDNSNGASVTVAGGATNTVATKTAGDVVCTGGDATGGTSTGGSVVLQAGDSTHATAPTQGLVNLVSGDDATYTVRVDATGQLHVDAPAAIDVATTNAAATGTVSIGTGTASGGASGAVLVRSGTGNTGDSGAVTVSAGTTDTGGGALIVQGGATTGDFKTAGALTASAGAGTGVTAVGGAVLIDGGDAAAGTGVGGDVVMSAGAGATTHGQLIIDDADGDPKITVNADGSVAVFGEVTASVIAPGLLTLQSTGAGVTSDANGVYAISSTASTATAASLQAMALSTTDRVGAAAGDVIVTVGTTDQAGGTVTFTGGSDSAASGFGGTVTVIGGEASGATSTGGDIALQPHDGTSTDGVIMLKSANNDAAAAYTARVTAAGALEVDAPSGVVIASATGTTSGTISVASGDTSNGATGAVSVYSGLGAGGVAGAVTVSGGGTTSGSSNAVTIVGGKNTRNPGTAGAVTVTGGEASGTADVGGTVTVSGGASDATGGNVIVLAGGGSTEKGAVTVVDGSGATAITLDTAGAIVTLANTGEDMTVTAAGALTLSAPSAAATLSGSAAVLVKSTTAKARVEGYITAGAVEVSTTGPVAAAGDILVKSGETDAGAGASVTMTGGKTTASPATGGDVTVTAGRASNAGTTTGGNVNLVGGAGSSTGGSIVLQPGAGATENGEVRLTDQGGVNRVDVSTDGTVTVASASAITWDAASAMSLSAGTTMTLSTAASTTTWTSTGADSYLRGFSGTTIATEAIAASNDVAVAPGSSDQTGGDLLVTGGIGTFATSDGGDVLWVGGEASGGGTDIGGATLVRGGTSSDGGSGGGGSVTIRAAASAGTNGRVRFQHNGPLGPEAVLTVDEAGLVEVGPRATATMSDTMTANGAVIYNIRTEAAGATVSMSVDDVILHITDDGDPVSVNTFQYVGTPVNGQMAVVINDDDNPTTTLLNVPAGEMHVYTYNTVVGWVQVQ